MGLGPAKVLIHQMQLLLNFNEKELQLILVINEFDLIAELYS